jgi:hypothetical protein
MCDSVLQTYSRVLEFAILDYRKRIRYREDVSMEEVHDLLDALHNIPRMLRQCDGWHIPENIDADLARYDAKWRTGEDSARGRPLIEYLNAAKRGDA